MSKCENRDHSQTLNVTTAVGMAHQGERAKAVGDVREESMGGGTGAVPSAAEAEKGEASNVCIRMVEIGVKESGHCTDGHRPIIAMTNGENMVGWPPQWH